MLIFLDPDPKYKNWALYSIIPILITFEKISIRMTIVVKLTTLMIGAILHKFFQGPNKRSEDLIINFEQFPKNSIRLTIVVKLTILIVK